MSKIIDKIITSTTAPNDTNVVWDDGKYLNIFRAGKWEAISSSGEDASDSITSIPIDLQGLFKDTEDGTKSVTVEDVESVVKTPYKDWFDKLSNSKIVLIFDAYIPHYTYNDGYTITMLSMADPTNMFSVIVFGPDIAVESGVAIQLVTETLITATSETSESNNIQFSSNATQNLNTLEKLNLTTNYPCKYVLSNTETIYGTYYNGTISSFYNNEITLWDVNFETGVITNRFTVDCEFIGTEVILDVCSAGSTEADKNLEKLTLAYTQLGDHFTVNIDAGIGVGKFIPSQGGEGHITTAEGVNVHYIFGTDGSVIKQKEIDLNAILAELDGRIAVLETV